MIFNMTDSSIHTTIGQIYKVKIIIMTYYITIFIFVLCKLRFVLFDEQVIMQMMWPRRC